MQPKDRMYIYSSYRLLMAIKNATVLKNVTVLNILNIFAVIEYVLDSCETYPKEI